MVCTGATFYIFLKNCQDFSRAFLHWGDISLEGESPVFLNNTATFNVFCVHALRHLNLWNKLRACIKFVISYVIKCQYVSIIFAIIARVALQEY
jgi:hypothetical protein